MRHLKAFHIFHVAASSLSYSDAAEKLCITHGAVSKQIKILEAYLGQSLYYRQGRNVRLTREGELLKSYTEQAFLALNAGIQKLSQMQDAYLEISCEPTLTMRWLMPRLSNFYQDNPHADVRLSTAGGPVRLGTNGISLAIRRDDFESLEDNQITELVHEWMGPVCSPEYWQKIKDELSQMKVLHSQTRPQAWSDWNRQAGANSLAKLPPLAQQSFAHFYFCLQAATDGLGLAMGSYPMVADDIIRGKLIAPFGFSQSGQGYILLSQQVNSDDPLESRFIHWLKKNMAQCIPDSSLIATRTE
ncbi:LysR substrate-binding domain-containing protein [Shewanella violacea]|uniref:TrpBA operon transcriptional activator n=1 Tax=Shewanella violacea (strain JCM 10179 / CIP 106290 / LMG 19151 / DSS12) TaxID=637905 RepID=D4ZL77_SHEVD|nr:LysR substrate-binding domain-containing protein [Shewanella violacea]BAJ02426.1 trpBA operon transcriptional activator [Shewanella violacea DSS12]